jgi:hypothetical protein
MGFVSKDEAGDRAAKTGSNYGKSKSCHKVDRWEADMPSPHQVQGYTINEVVGQIEKMLGETWQETGFGQLTIESERIKKNVIRVIVKGSTYYKFLISDEEVSKWGSRK